MSRQTPYMQRRGFGLSFRIAVPPDLRHIVGAREITKALPTSNKSQAAPLVLGFAACTKRMFCELRAGMIAVDEVKLKHAVQLARLKIKISDKDDEREKLEEEHREELRSLRVDADRRVAEGKLKAENEALKHVLAGLPALSLPVHPPAPETPLATPASGPVPTFPQVIDHFLDEYPKTKNPAMFKKHMVALPMLREFIGNIPVTQLRQTHINDFFTLLQRLPPRWKDQCRKLGLTIRQLAELEHPETIGPKTFDDSYKASIRPFLDDAVTNWQDSGFPTKLSLRATKYKGDRKEGDDKQRHFNPAELTRLFEGPEMKSFASDPAQAHCYLLPHVGLFTGARVNEVCQLNPQADILQDPETGIWYFWITEETEGDERIDKSTKNDESRRKVPIHSKLAP